MSDLPSSSGDPRGECGLGDLIYSESKQMGLAVFGKPYGSAAILAYDPEYKWMNFCPDWCKQKSEFTKTGFS